MREGAYIFDISKFHALGWGIQRIREIQYFGISEGTIRFFVPFFTFFALAGKAKHTEKSTEILFLCLQGN